jgi:hypothetical protein
MWLGPAAEHCLVKGFESQICSCTFKQYTGELSGDTNLTPNPHARPKTFPFIKAHRSGLRRVCSVLPRPVLLKSMARK